MHFNLHLNLSRIASKTSRIFTNISQIIFFTMKINDNGVKQNLYDKSIRIWRSLVEVRSLGLQFPKLSIVGLGLGLISVCIWS